MHAVTSVSSGENAINKRIKHSDKLYVKNTNKDGKTEVISYFFDGERWGDVIKPNAIYRQTTTVMSEEGLKEMQNQSIKLHDSLSDAIRWSLDFNDKDTVTAIRTKSTLSAGVQIAFQENYQKQHQVYSRLPQQYESSFIDNNEGKKTLLRLEQALRTVGDKEQITPRARFAQSAAGRLWNEVLYGHTQGGAPADVSKERKTRDGDIFLQPWGAETKGADSDSCGDQLWITPRSELPKPEHRMGVMAQDMTRIKDYKDIDWESATFQQTHQSHPPKPKKRNRSSLLSRRQATSLNVATSKK